MTVQGRVHIVGAGLAGLACATALAAAGRPVSLYEAGPQAGGRCRSFHDRGLGCRIDNGNHLILGANPETFRYLDRIGARARLQEIRPASIPFLDLEDGSRWCLRPGRGPVPFWLLDPARRVPGSRPTAYLAALRLAWSRKGASVADILGQSPLYRRLWSPLAVSILNTQPEEADARLLWEVFRRTLLGGEAACRPHIATDGLSDALVDPALDQLARHGVTTHLSSRLTALETGGRRATMLRFADGESAPVNEGDSVVLALPAPSAAQILPGVTMPDGHRAILNAHYRMDTPVRLPGGQALLGIVGGTAEWLFARGDVVSVTVSAADHLIDRPAEALSTLLWRDIARALNLTASCPPARIIKEKRATFAATPDNAARRPGPRTPLSNVLLAGDWTDTGLPATIEGAVQSGHMAAHILIR